jgi:hypothetical protein
MPAQERFSASDFPRSAPGSQVTHRTHHRCVGRGIAVLPIAYCSVRVTVPLCGAQSAKVRRGIFCPTVRTLHNKAPHLRGARPDAVGVSGECGDTAPCDKLIRPKPHLFRRRRGRIAGEAPATPTTAGGFALASRTCPPGAHWDNFPKERSFRAGSGPNEKPRPGR